MSPKQAAADADAEDSGRHSAAHWHEQPSRFFGHSKSATPSPPTAVEQQQRQQPSHSHVPAATEEEDAPAHPQDSRHSPGKRVKLVLPETSDGGWDSGSDGEDAGGCSSDDGQMSSRSSRVVSGAGKHKAFVSNMSRFKQPPVRECAAYATASSTRGQSLSGAAGCSMSGNRGQSMSGGPVPSLHAQLLAANGSGSHDGRSSDERNSRTHTRSFRPMHAPRAHGEDYNDPTAVDYDFDTGTPLELDDEFEDPLPSERSSKGRHSDRHADDLDDAHPLRRGFSMRGDTGGSHLPRRGYSMRGDEALLLSPGHSITTGSIIRRKAPMIPAGDAVGGMSFTGGATPPAAGSPDGAASNVSPPTDAIALQINASLAAHRAFLDGKAVEPPSPSYQHTHAANGHSLNGQTPSPGGAHPPQHTVPAAQSIRPVHTKPEPLQIPAAPTVAFQFSPTYSQPRSSQPPRSASPCSHAPPDHLMQSASTAAAPSMAGTPNVHAGASQPRTPPSLRIHTPPPHQHQLTRASHGSGSLASALPDAPASPAHVTPLTAAAAAAAAAESAAATAALAAAAAAASELAAAAVLQSKAAPEGRRSEGGSLHQNPGRRVLSRSSSHAAHVPTPEELVRRRAQQAMEKTRTRLEELEAERAKIEAVEFARAAQKHFQSSFPAENIAITKKKSKSYCHFTQSANYMKWVLHRADLVGRALDHNNQITIVGNNSREDAAGADAERQFGRVYNLTDDA
ncbi:MAG: hypothetical protein WDW36_000933 [Sanguina aurantia]